MDATVVTLLIQMLKMLAKNDSFEMVKVVYTFLVYQDGINRERMR